MNLSNLQASVGGLVAAVVTIAVALGLVQDETGKAIIAAAGLILPAVFSLVVAIENHGKKPAA